MFTLPRFSEGDMPHLMNELKSQLRKMSITDRSRLDEMFLRYNRDRNGFIDIENLKDMCLKIQLPPDAEVLDAVSLSMLAIAAVTHNV